jgi:trk system potassium uptake protein TrkA
MQTLQAWAGRKLKDLELRNKWGVTVLAIKRGDEIIAGPGADSTIEAEDTVVLFGSDKDLKRLENTKKGM